MIYLKVTQLLLGLLLVLFIVLRMSGFHPIDFLNFLTSKKGYSVYHNLAYGPLPTQKLDIYVPDALTTPHSTIVYFYGGSWQTGDKNMYSFIGKAFASKGFITVMVNYRLYPEVHFPAFVEDGAKALHWVHEHIEHYQGDPNHIFLAGHSAGAHIAALLVTDQRYIKAEGVRLNWIKGTIGIAGPYDFLPFTDPKIKALFSTVNDAETQPINYVKEELPPFLLVTGDKDTSVYPKNTINFSKELRRFKTPVTEIIYPNATHIGIMLSLSSILKYKTTLLEDIARFIEGVNTKPHP